MFSSRHAELVIEFISGIRQNSKVDTLFNKIEACGDVILIGGTVRDVAFGKGVPRDIDIIVDTNNDTLHQSLHDQFNCRINSFGGYKVEIEYFQFDIWSIENNWAFKNNFLPACKDNIPNGVFYNIDAILINMTNGHFWAEHFNNAMAARILDIVLEDNAALKSQLHELNIIRAFRLKKKWDVTFSKRVEKYIQEWVDCNENVVSKLKSESFRHFGDDSCINYESLKIGLNYNKSAETIRSLSKKL